MSDFTIHGCTLVIFVDLLCYMTWITIILLKKKKNNRIQIYKLAILIIYNKKYIIKKQN